MCSKELVQGLSLWAVAAWLTVTVDALYTAIDFISQLILVCVLAYDLVSTHAFFPFEMKFYRCWILWRKPLVLVVPGLFSLAFLGAYLQELQKLNDFRVNFTSSDFGNNPRLSDSISRLWYSGRASPSRLVRFSSCGILRPIFGYECPSHWSRRIQNRHRIPRHSRI